MWDLWKWIFHKVNEVAWHGSSSNGVFEHEESVALNKCKSLQRP